MVSSRDDESPDPAASYAFPLDVPAGSLSNVLLADLVLPTQDEARCEARRTLTDRFSTWMAAQGLPGEAARTWKPGDTCARSARRW